MFVKRNAAFETDQVMTDRDGFIYLFQEMFEVFNLRI